MVKSMRTDGCVVRCGSGSVKYKAYEPTPHHRESQERLRITLTYQDEMDLNPGETIDYHYTWLEHWMWIAVEEITEER